MKLKILLIGLLFISTSVFAERIEKEKITIDNDFVVVSNATFKSVTLTGGNINFYKGQATNIALINFTNGVTQNVGALSGTNGIYWTQNETNYWLLFE